MNHEVWSHWHPLFCCSEENTLTGNQSYYLLLVHLVFIILHGRIAYVVLILFAGGSHCIKMSKKNGGFDEIWMICVY